MTTVTSEREGSGPGVGGNAQNTRPSYTGKQTTITLLDERTAASQERSRRIRTQPCDGTALRRVLSLEPSKMLRQWYRLIRLSSIEGEVFFFSKARCTRDGHELDGGLDGVWCMVYAWMRAWTKDLDLFEWRRRSVRWLMVRCVGDAKLIL